MITQIFSLSCLAVLAGDKIITVAEAADTKYNVSWSSMPSHPLTAKSVL